MAKKEFNQNKHDIASRLLLELDEKVTSGCIGEMTASAGGVKLVWSKKLNSTAGRANWKRETIRQRTSEGVLSTTYGHHASIELAEKVIDDEGLFSAKSWSIPAHIDSRALDKRDCP